MEGGGHEEVDPFEFIAQLGGEIQVFASFRGRGAGNRYSLAAGCDRNPVEAPPPPADLNAGSAAEGAMVGARSETIPLVPMKAGVEGTSTLHRRANGFTFRIRAHGLTPGHPVTLWVIDQSSGNVGRAAGGLVGGAGSVNLAGNHCVEEGGKSPGIPPVCNLIDPAGDIMFVLLEGADAWTPGDQDARWNPGDKPVAAVAEHDG